MPDSSYIKNLRKQLTAHRERLATLLHQIALQGTAYALPGQISGIAEARREIARLKKALRAAGVAVKDQVDDEEPVDDEELVGKTGEWAKPARWSLMLGGLVALVAVSMVIVYLFTQSQKGSSELSTLTSPTIDISPVISNSPGENQSTEKSPTTTIMVKNDTASLLEDAKQWTLVFTDTLDTNINQWSVSDTFITDDFGNHRLSIHDGKLFFEADSKAPGGALIWNFKTPLPGVQDFYLGIDLTCEQCTPLDSPGIVFRLAGSLDAERFYFFRMNFDQTVVVAKQPSGRAAERIEKTSTTAFSIRQNETNRIEIIAKQERIIVFINHILVIDKSDGDFRNGTIHFSLYIPNDESAIMSLDNIELRVPETTR